jgi:hypothetical protein
MPTAIYDSSLLTQRKRDKAIAQQISQANNNGQRIITPQAGYGSYYGGEADNGAITYYRKEGSCTDVDLSCNCSNLTSNINIIEEFRSSNNPIFEEPIIDDIYRSTQIIGDINILYDSIKPDASIVNNSAITPIIVRATANRTYSYTFTELITANPPYTYVNGEYSDLLKFINNNQTYTFTLILQNSIGINYSHIIQPNEVLTAFYNPIMDEWLFVSSLL